MTTHIRKEENSRVRVLVVGTGGMARVHVEAYQAMDGVEVVGGVDPREGPRTEFLARHAIPHGFSTVEEALAWGNSTPFPT